MLDKLIKERLIKMVDDRDLLDLLDKYFHMPVRTFLTISRNVVTYLAQIITKITIRYWNHPSQTEIA
ncbi:hypothetical protein LZ11_00774 [Thermosediminibacter litoriperuensis]|uniref:Uncharacterized protein n=1 Tax=Thermosediminibacter litoriperuensis TaxID=291989 RepID=A0A5S5AXA5_9FIRM|nr:hypothetical protein LZ11_00774 [Thermosediminibacter litoriperuensis]